MMRYLAALLFCLTCVAAEAAVDASAFVERWSARGRRLGLMRGRRVVKVVRHDIGGTAPVFHETRFEGGGFAVVDASSGDGEVIAFSEQGEVVESEDNPLWILLKQHMMLKAIGGAAVPLMQTSSSTVSDLRVAPLLQTHWNQQTAAGYKCYNYYTPNGYYCGCVATAMAMTMRYHEWPSAPSRIARNQCWVGQVSTNMTMLGGPYDWQGMPYRPGDGCTESNREAIGRLTYDCGVAMHMQYASGGSGAYADGMHLPLKDLFGYRSAFSLSAGSGQTLSETSVRNAILASLDAKAPVPLGIANFDGKKYNDGHCIVADGYGFIDGEAYVHLNFGWTGSCIAWYKLPDIGAGYGFNIVDTAVFNVFPQQEGEVLSGHVTDCGTNVVGVVVGAYLSDGSPQATAQTDTNGVYALIVPSATTYSVEVSHGGKTQSVLVSTGRSVSYTSFSWNTGYGYPLGCTTCGNRWGNDFDLSSPVPPERDPRLFVSAATGSDVTGTGEESAPFATIGAALAKAVEGDTILVGPGVYSGMVSAVASTVKIVSTDGSAATVIDADGQGPCYCGSANEATLLSGFTLRNGWATRGGGVQYGTASNCVIRGCVAYYDGSADAGYGGGAYGATLYDTYVAGCEADAYGGGVAASTVRHCTVSGNWAGGAGGGADVDSKCYDSIVWCNATYAGAVDNWETYTSGWTTYRTSFDHSCTSPKPPKGTGNLAADPLFTCAEEADFRLRSGSPCLGAASDGGNMGAWRGGGVSGARIAVTVEGAGEVSPAAAFLTPGETVTFEASDHHPFVAYATNGVVVSTVPQVTLPCPSEDLTLTARFGPTNFCVDAVHGDDARDGWSWATAKRTIQAAADVLGDDERIAVRPGVYDGFVSYSAGGEIVSTDGAGATVIDARGEGRCFADAGDTVLRGFTLVNASAGGYAGGGAYRGRLVDCVISNCTASAGGGAALSMLERCVLAGNVAEGQGGGAYDCLVERCTVFGNRAGQPQNALSEFAGGGVDCQCDCTNSIVWGNSSAAAATDNWESFAVRSPRGTTYNVPRSMDHCCTEPRLSIGTGNVFRDPQLVGPTAGDLRLYECSPCIGTATDGGNIGAYVGSGVRIEIPSLPAEPTAADVTAAVAAVGYRDPDVVAYIGTSAERYESFRQWAAIELGQTTAVARGLKSYLSYAVRDIVASPTLFDDLTETKIDLPSLAPGDSACELTVRLTDGGTVVPLAAVRAAFAEKVRLGTTPGGLSPATAEDIQAARANADGTVTLGVRAPSRTAGFYDVRVR